MYEYRCPACEAVFEELVRSPGEEARVACPQCGATNVERQPSVFAAHAATPRATPPPGCGRCGESGSCPYAE
jgi:putative FmdB family regulatory protein